jgi:hypothetical protein
MAEEFKRPGWYPDPEGKAGERWWNGTTWSDSRRGGAAPAAAPVAPTYVAPPVSTTPPVYSADNPAPQRPDPYGQPITMRQALGSRVTSIDLRSNRPAMIGFITGMITIFFVAFLAPVAIVASIMGIVKARQLKEQGQPGNSATFAWIGLGTGILGGVIGLVSLIAFIVAIAPTVS